MKRKKKHRDERLSIEKQYSKPGGMIVIRSDWSPFNRISLLSQPNSAILQPSPEPAIEAAFQELLEAIDPLYAEVLTEENDEQN